MGKLQIGPFHSVMHGRRAGKSELYGVTVELASALRRRAGVDIDQVEHLAPPQVIESFKASACDIAFLGIDPIRGRERPSDAAPIR